MVYLLLKDLDAFRAARSVGRVFNFLGLLIVDEIDGDVTTRTYNGTYPYDRW